MENSKLFEESPFKNLISFHKLIESLEEIALSDVDYRSNYAKALLKEIEHIPEFRTGIEDLSIIEENQTLIKYLLSDLFPTALTKNEIKAVTIPFLDFTFNYTERFNKILKDAGGDFDMTIRDFDSHQFYILNCSIILNFYYKQQFNLNKPLFYDIPDENGIIKHYKIHYNADFLEVTPTDKAILLTQEDIDLLMDNYDDIKLWKEKFPTESWVLKGFSIMILYDATIESAISNLKSKLLKSENDKENINDNIEIIFRSIFKVPDLKVGIIIYNEEENKFTKPQFNNKKIGSFIICNEEEIDCKNAFFECFINTIINDKKPLSISNIERYASIPQNKALGEHLLNQNIKSIVLSPILKEDKLIGIIELASTKPRALNSINATNLDLVISYIVDAMERYNRESENHIEAIIQREYTAIHSSVYWKFRKEAEKYYLTNSPSKEYIFKEIVFKEVYPLYGQIDIKGSSQHRNSTVKEDLKNQLKTLLGIIERLKNNNTFSLLDQRKFEMQMYYNELEQELKADTEQQIQTYIQKEIHPILTSSKNIGEYKLLIDNYFEELDPKTDLFYHSRKKFDEAMSIINKKMASILDKEQRNAQAIYPHYFERFKTDGVEHNLYIGASITPRQPFDTIYLNNLRLWQLQTLCKMELEHHRLKVALPYELEVTSLILVFSSPLSIRFRMDEKRFDVDGTYNARYEIVKKRIDKAHIKGTTERISEKEKITIVYSHSFEEAEYLKYIKFLQFKKILEPAIEQFDIEELQGVSGLKALRIKIVNTDSSNDKYSYQELLKELH